MTVHCSTCAKVKITRTPIRSSIHPPLFFGSEVSWDTKKISITGIRGDNSFGVFTDSATKFGKVDWYKDDETADKPENVKVLVEEWFSDGNVLKVLNSDRAKNLMSRAVKNFCANHVPTIQRPYNESIIYSRVKRGRRNFHQKHYDNGNMQS